MRATLTIVASVAVLSLASVAAHAACDARSPDYLVALIELYTSEGCDSCPPADNWLSRLVGGDKVRPAVDRVVPIAFHVDYWDRLGWKDRFASAKYTDRQYEQMAASERRSSARRSRHMRWLNPGSERSHFVTSFACSQLLLCCS